MRTVALPLVLSAALAAPASSTAEEPARPDLTPSSPVKPAEAKPSDKAGELDLGQKKPAPAAVLEEVTGTVAALDRQAARLDLTTAKGPVSLKLDRNTLVYTQAGLGTVLDIAPGQPIRAGRNATSTAYWVQIRPAPAKVSTPSTPAQGTGPSGGAGPSTTEGGGTAPPVTPPSTGPVGPAPGGR